MFIAKGSHLLTANGTRKLCNHLPPWPDDRIVFASEFLLVVQSGHADHFCQECYRAILLEFEQIRRDRFPDG